ncbi:PP2C family protein-serine/threonine phosphatase [Listeria grandensis]|uniref:RsbU protein n=2 Tax=Listeria grandensis TaxID=1494963 RepID=W7B612_9LIST|nr:PP2C family protein-serine/threonine phosphatase [Listeria grandensis]EUJ22749.1 RsbU protein [Listeria grandensis FSL F6-0971]MBC1475488.1 PP2C family protein-serine/threonine phosphatase [Listeria grandensis]MBC1936256.1 PP2C family protein-serine/threonine phosphatase [Listeria grandensis]MBC6315186.1 PP2C family protein-serine/threonine phosphatase [Listeria grandensis]
MESREIREFKERYRNIILKYLEQQDEEILYSCERLTREAMEKQVSPEEVVNLHRAILEEYDADLPEYVSSSFDVLLEMMVGYGLAHMEHISLRTEQQALRREIAQAEDMQKTMMKSDIPNVVGIEVGAVSVPMRQMSGDFYSFTNEGDNKISVTLADVIGKGIPAAFSMSMLKYASDNYGRGALAPSEMLRNLNEVAEANIDDNMFITMFYGLYDTSNHLFEYASAGHEVGLYFSAKTQQFSDLYARGLPLGIDRNATYRAFEKEVEPDDMIFIMSDGVTETRTADGFMEREHLIAVFQERIHLPPQKLVKDVYDHLCKVQDYELRDDFTLICLKRV